MLQENHETATSYEPTRLRDAWSLIRSLRPTAPQRQGAEDLGVTEAQLVAAHCGHSAVRLRGRWAALLGDLVQLGAVQGLTRNEHAVIEAEGVYRDLRISNDEICVVDQGINLAATTRKWASAFAVREVGRFGVRNSLQFFDDAGLSAHKLFLGPHSAGCAFDAITNLYADEDQSDGIFVRADTVRALGSCPQIDIGELRARFAHAKSVGEAGEAIEELGGDRLRALRLLGEPHARRAVNSAVLRALELAAVRFVAIKASVANAAAVQSFEGTVLNVKPVAGWVNVLDTSFNLHVRAAAIAETWIVQTPTEDEPEVTLEMFDHESRCIATLGGASGEGPFEYERWLGITDELTA